MSLLSIGQYSDFGEFMSLVNLNPSRILFYTKVTGSAFANLYFEGIDLPLIVNSNEIEQFFIDNGFANFTLDFYKQDGDLEQLGTVCITYDSIEKDSYFAYTEPLSGSDLVKVHLHFTNFVFAVKQVELDAAI